MSRQEVLIVGILNVAHHDATPDDEDVLAGTRVQMNRIDDGTTEANRVVKFDLSPTGDLLLAKGSFSHVRFAWGLKLLWLCGDLLRHRLLHHY